MRSGKKERVSMRSRLSNFGKKLTKRPSQNSGLAGMSSKSLVEEDEEKDPFELHRRSIGKRIYHNRNWDKQDLNANRRIDVHDKNGNVNWEVLEKVAAVLPTVGSGYGLDADEIYVKRDDVGVKKRLDKVRNKRGSIIGQGNVTLGPKVTVKVDRDFEELRRNVLGGARDNFEAISEDMAILRRKHLGAEEEKHKIGALKLSDEDMDELLTESEDEDEIRAKSPTMNSSMMKKRTGTWAGTDSEEDDDEEEDSGEENDDDDDAKTPISPKTHSKNKRRLSVQEVQDLSRHNDWGKWETTCSEEELVELLAGDSLALTRAYPFSAPFKNDKKLSTLLEMYLGIDSGQPDYDDFDDVKSDDDESGISAIVTSGYVQRDDEDDMVLKMTHERREEKEKTKVNFKGIEDAASDKGSVGSGGRPESLPNKGAGGKSSLQLARERAAAGRSKTR
ncbi:hypothetical protein TrLO_g10396 [Triparma laevis f. longispina]|uniref:Uncharacterized protein n=1 Tax=Triparma laevis f. longispina TaxID=1714387 RepID=A0A9W7AU51_9STRA|nr:hypothetical protein TrLO_g10396 [Triparma laevis f. longispina]